MIYWPAELPAPLIGTTYNPVDPQMRTTMQSGRTLARRKFTVVPVRFQARWIFRSDAHAALFEDFYRVATIDGAEWFAMPLLLPQGRDYRSLRFIGPYSGPKRVNPPGADGDFWEYSAVLELSQRPSEIAPQPPPPPPGGVPRPPGVPQDAEDLLTENPGGLWALEDSGNTNFTISAATYDGVDYNGGIEATKRNPAAESLGFILRSIGTWYQNRTPGRIYIYFKVRRVSTPVNFGGFSASGEKGTVILPQTSHSVPLGTSYFLFTTDLFPVNPDVFNFSFIGTSVASTNLFSIVYIGVA